MNRAIKLLAATALSAATLGAGLAVSSGGGLQAATGASQPDTLVVALAHQWAGNFLPSIMESDQGIFQQEFLMLMGTEPNNTVGLIGGLVSKYTLSKNERTYTFWLNPKARWSDGRRVSSRDVQIFLQFVASKYYVDDFAGPDTGAFSDIVGMTTKNGQPLPNGTTPSGFKSLGKYKFSLTTTTASPTALMGDVGRILPLPYFVLHKIPFKDWVGSSFDHLPNISDGPWVMTKVIPGEVVVMKANKYFEYGPPKIHTLEFKYVPDTELAGDLIKGYVNWSVISGREYRELKGVPSLKVAAYPPRGDSDITWVLNNAKYGKVFDNVHFRRGVMYALNRPAMAHAFGFGLARLMTTPIPDMYSWYDPAANSGKYAYPFNTARAVAEFRKAGLVLNKKTGWFDFHGKTFKPTFTYPSGSVSGAETATAIATYLHKAHVDLVLNPPEDFNTLLAQMSNNANGTKPPQGVELGDVLCAGPSFTPTTPEACATCLSGLSMKTLPAFQKQSIKLVTEQKSPKAFNYAYRKRVIDDWQMLFAKCVPCDILWGEDTAYAWSSDLHGVINNGIKAFRMWQWHYAPSH
jgi:ABC-type transport system substrate-binding protein